MSSHAAEAEAARFARRRLRLKLAAFPETRGTVVAVVLMIAFVAAATLTAHLTKPPAPVALRDGDAVVTPTGEAYVIDDGIAYPATNLASARLAGERTVYADAAALRAYPRGATRGILGAPATLPTASDIAGETWQLCTAGDASTVTISFGSAPYLSPASSEQVVLDDGVQSWVVRNGVRFAVASTPGMSAIPTIPELTALIPSANDPSPAADAPAPGGRVVCAQSDPAAPFARPSAAAIDRAATHANGVSVTGSRGTVSIGLRPGTGVLAFASEGGYWLLTSSGELNRIDDDQALRRLGLSKDDARAIPESILALLKPGPVLSIDAARAPVTNAQQ